MKKKSIIFLLVIVFCFSGCVSSNKIDEKVAPLKEGQMFTDDMLENNSFVSMFKNAEYELFLNAATAEIMIQKAQSAQSAQSAQKTQWYSNPPSRFEDEIAGTVGQQRLSSQFDINYYDADDIAGSMNSYSDCVDKKQHEIEKIEGGVRITYYLGTAVKTWIVPKVIKQQDFEKLLEKTDQKDGLKRRYQFFDLNGASIIPESIKKAYPIVEQTPVYILNDNLADFVMKELEQQLDLAGYTQQDLDRDNELYSAVQKNDEMSFVIPVEYLLNERGFSAAVKMQHVKYSKGVKLTDINLLPFFGAASSDQKGYIVVPDGSGALINFNNGKTHLPAYYAPLYGEDISTLGDDMPQPKEQNHLNIFGMKTEQSAFCAVVESADSIAYINADTSGRNNSFNFAYASFKTTKSMSLSIDISGAKEMNFYEDNLFADDLRVQYLLMDDERDYIGMANYYREYLLDKNLLNKSEVEQSSMHLELLGAATYTDTVVGMPVKLLKPLTTYLQAQEIIKSLHDKGVSTVNLNYQAFANNGMENTLMNKINLISKLGSTEDFKKLVQECEINSGKVYGDVQLQYIAKNNLFDSYNSNFDATKNILDKKAQYPIYDIATQKLADGRDMLSPAKYLGNAREMAVSLKRHTNAVSMASMSTDLYSDYSRSHKVSRQQAIDIIDKTYTGLKNDGLSVLAKNANAYVLNNVDYLSNLVRLENPQQITDETIPFYQAIISGRIPYSTSPINLSSDIDALCSKMAEYGATPTFSWMHSNNDVLKDIKLNMYGLYYEDWILQAVEISEKIQPVLERTFGAKISQNTFKQNGVSVTEYDNGARVYVNHTGSEIVYQEIILKSFSWEVR